MKVFITLALCVGLAAAACSDLKILTENSDTKDWFDIKLNPEFRDSKEARLVWGFGWNDGERSFHGPYSADQIITLSAVDGSAFKLYYLSVKTTNTFAVKFIATYVGGKTETLELLEPTPIDDRWGKVTVRARREDAMLSISMQIVPDSTILAERIDRRNRVYIRGLKMKACPV